MKKKPKQYKLSNYEILLTRIVIYTMAASGFFNIVLHIYGAVK